MAHGLKPRAKYKNFPKTLGPDRNRTKLILKISDIFRTWWSVDPWLQKENKLDCTTQIYHSDLYHTYHRSTSYQLCSVSSLHWAILLSKLSRLMHWEWKSARLGVLLRARKLVEGLNLLFGTFQNVQKFWLGISNLKKSIEHTLTIFLA